MRILIVSQYFVPEYVRVNDVAKGLSERGHEVTVLTGQPNYETGSFYEGYSAFRPAREEIDGLEVLRFPLVSRGQSTGARLAVNYLSFALSSALLAPLRVRKSYDAILVCQVSPVTMAAPAFVLKGLRRTPVVFWIQDMWPETLRATGKVRSETVLDCIRTLVGMMYRASDRVLVKSEGFLSAVYEAGVPPERVSYVPEWAESWYRPLTLEPHSPESREVAGSFRVMYAGNIGVAQSMETIIDAASLLREYNDIQWVMIGDGRRRPEAEERVDRLGLSDQFSFLGRRPAHVMPRYFALADVLLVTLRRDPLFEMIIPSKVPAYLACGRPIVAALDGEGERIIRSSGAGLACRTEDPRALAEAVLTVYRMPPDVREEMGRAGRTYFEAHFEREDLLSQLEGIIESVAKTSRGRLV